MSGGGQGRPATVGKLRPSQVVTQHGPGAVVDLPELSVIMAGIDYWSTPPRDRVSEPRLERFLRVQGLFRPSESPGVPAFIFPEWLVCPKCRLLAPFRDFSFRHGSFTCVRGDSRHGRGRAPEAFPARFMVACPAGHLDDFPWLKWVHGEAPCDGPLELIDTGTSGSASDLMVQCSRCDSKQGLGGAFGKAAMTGCTGRRPWLSPRRYESGCQENPKTILRGASNAYFPVVASALSIPPWSDPIHRDLVPYRDQMKNAKSLEHLREGIAGEFYAVGDLLETYTVEDLWKALHTEPDEDQDLKPREYSAFLHPGRPSDGPTDFEVVPTQVPSRFVPYLRTVVAASRLREVRALRGFTRIDYIPDLGERTDVSDLDVSMAPLGGRDVDWLPGIDFRGEGIFLQVNPEELRRWETRVMVVQEGQRLASRFRDWSRSRNLPERQFPGMRYVLLHSLAHVLMRQLALDCGYASSALRERIYCAPESDDMGGILIYTASSDSDGSLGGLVEQASPHRLGPTLAMALRDATSCSSDPLCGGGAIQGAPNLNGAACHACLLLAETSCEYGNRLLNRATLVDTLGEHGMKFFGGDWTA